MNTRINGCDSCGTYTKVSTDGDGWTTCRECTVQQGATSAPVKSAYDYSVMDDAWNKHFHAWQAQPPVKPAVRYTVEDDHYGLFGIWDRQAHHFLAQQIEQRFEAQIMADAMNQIV